VALALLGEFRLRHWVFLWPLLLTVLVLIRQSRPFEIVSDDRSYYSIAQGAANAAQAAYETAGLWGGVQAFADACSVHGELPPHISRKRPVLLYVWSLAYLLAGNEGLQWTWRGLYVLTILALFLILRHLSNDLVASILTGVVSVAPATQGLLAWMSCSTYLVSYSALLLGILLLSGRRLLTTGIGLLFLCVGMASREVAFLIVATAGTVHLYLTDRKRVAALLPVLAVVLWLLLPSESRSTFTVLGRDPALFFRGSGLVVAAESAGIIRNVGLMFSVVVLWALRPKWAPFAIALGALSVVTSASILLVPLAVITVAGLTTRQSLCGILWIAVSVASMCLYGNFTSRYVFEPLIGLALLLAPALMSTRKKTLFILLPMILWQSASTLFPDTVFSVRAVRVASDLVDRRFAALHVVTRLRRNEWETFAGRVPYEWHLIPDMRLLCPGGEGACGRVWRSKKYWRVGNPLCLQCDTEDQLVFTRSEIWEWNVWYWRTVPARKRAGVHVQSDAARWEVHVGNPLLNHDTCFFVVTKPLRQRSLQSHHVVERWIDDLPECRSHRIVATWLSEVWSIERGCPRQFSESSFTELELGRLLIRDDGWFDTGELTYLRTRAREKDVTPFSSE
jgi:hypothetical protein